MHRLCLFLLCTAAIAAAAEERPPRSLDARLKIELFAEHPQIATPTGLDVDAQGRVWALESNTHFRPNGYAGHPTDRLLVMSDNNADGRADEIVTFADGFTHAMSVSIPAVHPAQGRHVYVATRSEIVLLTDTDGDLRADSRRRIVHLDTPGNYPHNGLAGFAWDAEGWMYFGFGENLGAKYRIIGSDGRTLSGGGEGGNLYRCRPDGTQLTLWATGFWNPHASCIDAHGRMFTVDNDPDSRPPCRLLHVIRGGDYGYRFRNGRKGLHPFTAWNGEIPGTLPMVAGTGEAPSGIVAYRASGLPEEYRGTLLVTSWGDHRIDCFRLKPKGASYESLPETVITGGENFRPVGLAVAPDGSLYCTDWVQKDYQLHGKGRVWRISSISPTKGSTPAALAPPPRERAHTLLAALQERVSRQQIDEKQICEALGQDDPFLISAAVEAIAASLDDPSQATRWIGPNASSAAQGADASLTAKSTLVGLLAARRAFPREQELARRGLESADPLVRRLAVQWVAEERLDSLRPQVEALLDQQPMTTDLFLAILAALELLDGRDPSQFDKTPAGKYVLPILLDTARPAAVRGQALRLVAPSEPALTAALFRELLGHEDRALRLEAVRTLQFSPLPEAATLLAGVASDEHADVQLRAEAIVGLANALAGNRPSDVAHNALLEGLQSREPELIIEALRALRESDLADDRFRAALAEVAKRLSSDRSLDERRDAIADELARLHPKERPDRPKGVDAWLQAANRGGDPQAGRRVFFHPRGAGCWKCHTVQGRGGAIGPELSMIARTMNREKLARSILEPSKEIAPQFTSWTFVMTSGQVHQGLLLGDTRDDKQRIGTVDGREIVLNTREIEVREPSSQSIMPGNLTEQLTLEQFRDLLAWLETLK